MSHSNVFPFILPSSVCGRKRNSKPDFSSNGVECKKNKPKTKSKVMDEKKRGTWWNADCGRFAKVEHLLFIFYIQTSYRWQNQRAHIKKASQAFQTTSIILQENSWCERTLLSHWITHVQMDNNPDDVSDIVKRKNAGQGGSLNGNSVFFMSGSPEGSKMFH